LHESRLLRILLPVMRRERTWMVLLLTLAVVGCTAQQSSPPPPPEPLTLDQLKNATYQGLEGLDAIKLANGRWDDTPEAGGAAPRSVQFVRDFQLNGDLDGDGADEAVVLLAESSGGSGEFLHVAVVDRRDGQVANVATALIGDRVQVRSAEIDSNRIVLQVVQSGTMDPACCPGELATRTWTFDGATLTPGEDDVVTGRLSPEVLVGTDWVLRWWDWLEPTAEDADVTLTYNEGRLAGKSGCNRYSAPVQSGENAGDITLGPTIGTRMACPGTAMEVESRYLKNLAGVKKIGFMVGLLALSYEVDNEHHVMLFERREPQVAGQ
jgi:heat shock protein HslJ